MEHVLGRKAWRKWAWAGVALGWVFCIGVTVHMLHPLVESSMDRSRRQFEGWDVLAAAVQEERARSDAERVWILTDSYQFAAQLAFHLKDTSYVRVWPGSSHRESQYDLWGVSHPEPGDAVVYVATGDRWVPRDLAQWFWSEGPPREVPLGGYTRRGHPRTATLFALEGVRQATALGPGGKS
jgi:hypothetical protein